MRVTAMMISVNHHGQDDDHNNPGREMGAHFNKHTRVLSLFRAQCGHPWPGMMFLWQWAPAATRGGRMGRGKGNLCAQFVCCEREHCRCSLSSLGADPFCAPQARDREQQAGEKFPHTHAQAQNNTSLSLSLSGNRSPRGPCAFPLLVLASVCSLANVPLRPLSQAQSLCLLRSFVRSFSNRQIWPGRRSMMMMATAPREEPATTTLSRQVERDEQRTTTHAIHDNERWKSLTPPQLSSPPT